MYIWPSSSTLTEDGAAQPSGGSSMFGNGGGGGKAQAAMGGAAAMATPKAGEISISRAESIALSAMETEPDEKHGLRRARAESGLTEQQIKMLQRRANHARSKGYTLVGVGAKFAPSQGSPEEPSLVKKAQRDAQAVTEALREQNQRSLYTLPKASDFRLPVPSSLGERDGADSVQSIDQSFLPRQTELLRMGPVDEDPVEETNAQSTMTRLMAANRRRKRSRY